MPFLLIIKEEAHRDVAAAYDYYESCQPGLGEQFLEALVSRYADLSQHPQFYSYIAEDPKQVLRDVKLERFPYVVIYEISELDKVIIYAVHSTYRDPSRK
jgi:plasmid stabilization system protein ParE